MLKGALVVVILVGLGFVVTYATSAVAADAGDYDANGNGRIEHDEALAVIIDYFRGEVTRDDVLEVLVLYFFSVGPNPTPEPTATPSPTPTPNATPIPLPSNATPYQGDITAPEIIDIVVEPSGINVSTRSALVRVTLRANDDLAGVSSVYMKFESPSGKQSNGFEVHRPTSGTTRNGTYKYTMTLPQFSEGGTWRLESAGIWDEVGNENYYSATELASLGLSTSFQVGGPEQDVAPTGFRPRSLWTEQTPATLEELEWEIEKYRGGSFVFTSWGGSYQAAQRQAYVLPFADQFGIEIVEDSPPTVAKVRAMVETNNFLWHIVDMGGRDLWGLIPSGYLEELDMAAVDNRAYPEVAQNSYSGGGGVTWSTVLAYNTDSYPSGTITDWGAFFDQANYPGRRSVGNTNTYSGSWSSWLPALLANYPSRLYDPDWKARLGAPTDEDVQEALALWERNPPYHFWATGSDCQQLLINGEVSMCTAWNNRIRKVQQEEEPVAICWECGHLVGMSTFAMPKGLREVDPAAFEIGQLFIAWTGQPEVNSRIAKYITSGPLNLGAEEYLNGPEFDDVRSAIPTSAENLPYAVFEDARYSSEKQEEWKDLWDGFMTTVGR